MNHTDATSIRGILPGQSDNGVSKRYTFFKKAHRLYHFAYPILRLISSFSFVTKILHALNCCNSLAHKELRCFSFF